MLDELANWWRTSRERWLTSTPPGPGVSGVEENASHFGQEFVRALALATASGVDEQTIVETIATSVGWTTTRARWFFAVNREHI